MIPYDNTVHINKRIKAACKERGVRLDDLADAMGFAPGYFSRPASSITAIKLIDVCNYLEVNADELFRYDAKTIRIHELEAEIAKKQAEIDRLKGENI